MPILEPNRDYRTPSLYSNQHSDTNLVHQDAIRHYDECYNDYLFAWCNRENLALHYGYWDQETRSHHQALLNKNSILYQLGQISSTDCVLDAGCGIGGSSIWMAKHHQNQVTGITISQNQAIQATRHAQRQGVENLVRFEISDFCQTPFQDQHFDVIWGLESICHAVNKGDFLQEAFRLLKPEGRLVVCDGFITRREFSDDEWQDIIICLDGWAVPNLCSRTEFQSLLQSTGFTDIQFHDITEQTRPSSDHMFRIAKRLKPIQTISQWLGLRSQAQTANFKVGLSQYRLFQDNLVEYGIFTAKKPG
jgi:tocopherol O-methyltransferase